MNTQGRGEPAFIGRQLLGDLLATEADEHVGRYRGGEDEMDEVLSDDFSNEDMVEEDAANVVSEEMQKLAKYALTMRSVSSDWQNAIRAQCYAQLQRGFFPGTSPDREEVVEERRFKCSRVINATDLENAGGLYDELRKGRVIAHVVGKTGLGKSTKLSAEIAARVGCRVLQIAPDAVLKSEHGKKLAARGVKVINRWIPTKEAMVSVMSPKEFCGRFFGNGWRQMLERFDVIVLDEAHIPEREYYAIKRVFSSKGVDKTSLLMLSATVLDQKDLQSSKLKPMYIPKTIEEMVGSPRFMDSEFAVDRAMFLVESDERIRGVAAALVRAGCEVYTLSKGASIAAVEAVSSKFLSDAASVRVLVAHASLGTGYNIPVSRVVTTGLRRVVQKTTEGYGYRCVPLTSAEVKQHLGRASRGIVPTAGPGVVLLSEAQVAPDVELIESEKFGAYVLLTAMGIEPCRELHDAVKEVLPYSITRRVAVSLLSVVGLPVEVTIRFLGEDGRFPSNYGEALQNFSTCSTNYLVSAKKKPLGFESWVPVRAFGMFKEEKGPMVKVPFVCTGELMTVLVLVCAAAERVFTPSATTTIEVDGYESGPEGEDSGANKRFSIGYLTPVQDLLPPVVEKPRVREIARDKYAYTVPLNEQAQFIKRRGLLPSPKFLDDLALKSEPIVEVVVQDGGSRVVHISLPISPGTVSSTSPGGTPVAYMPEEMWKTLMRGDILPELYVDMLLTFLENDCKSFALSSAFDSWNNAWISVLRTFCSIEVVQRVRDKNYGSLVIAFLAYLWDRYKGGMMQAVVVSHHATSYWESLVRSFVGGSKTRPLVHVRSNSRVEISQSEKFKQRLYDIRMNFACVIVAFEEAGMFSPYSVSEMQRILPVSEPLGSHLFDAVEKGRANRPYLSFGDERVITATSEKFKNKR